MADIQLNEVTKTYPGASEPAVRPVTVEMPSGALTALVGPSGCGKTTILKMINRLIEPTAGQILIDGRDARSRPTHELRRDIGYVIQQVGLFPHRTVSDNIATVPRLIGWDSDRIADRVRELVGIVGLEDSMLDRYPAALSGGQQQRVGVARALAADPPILLMDEPYSAVDPIVRTRLQDDLVDLQARLEKTIVLVTHDVDEAIKLGDQMVLLNTGGSIEQVGPPDELLGSPANAFVESFLGSERGLKRLSLRTVESVAVPVNGTDVADLPVVEALAPLREALDVILASPADEAAVVDGDGTAVGVVDVAAISKALR